MFINEYFKLEQFLLALPHSSSLFFFSLSLSLSLSREPSLITQSFSNSSSTAKTDFGNQTPSNYNNVNNTNQSQQKMNSDVKHPTSITVKFTPRKNIRYNSRFRFVCEYGNSFDVILQGEGTYEEHEHKPLSPCPE